MSILNNFFSSKIHSGDTSYTGFKGFDSYDSVLLNQIMKRIINDALGSLSYKDYWADLYSSNLSTILLNYIFQGQLKGYLYFGTKNQALGFSYKKENRPGTQIIPVDIKLTNDESKKIIAFSSICEMFKSHAIITSNIIKMSSMIQVKLNQGRQSISSDDKESVVEKVKESLDGDKNSMVILDKDDILEFFNSSDSKALIQHRESIIEQLVMISGFPSSYFTGIFKTGLGVQSVGDKEMIIQARENFYYEFLYQFFKIIIDYSNVDIRPESKLKDRFNPMELVELCNSNELIDNIEIYKQLGIPIKNKI